MGLYLTTHIGVYVRIKCMPTSDNGSWGWQDFLEAKDYEYEDELADIGEWLNTPDDEEILISMQAPSRSLELGDIMSFDASDVQKDKDTFEEYHSKMIKEMKNFFGDSMTVEHGFILYQC